MDKEISHRKALTLVAMNKLWILWHRTKISRKKTENVQRIYSPHIALLWHVVIDEN